MLGAIETARKSPLVLDRVGVKVGAVLFAGCSREIVPSSSFSTLIMTVPVIGHSVRAKDSTCATCPSIDFLSNVPRLLQEQCHRQTVNAEKYV